MSPKSPTALSHSPQLPRTLARELYVQTSGVSPASCIWLNRLGGWREGGKEGRRRRENKKLKIWDSGGGGGRNQKRRCNTIWDMAGQGGGGGFNIKMAAQTLDRSRASADDLDPNPSSRETVANDLYTYRSTVIQRNASHSHVDLCRIRVACLPTRQHLTCRSCSSGIHPASLKYLDHELWGRMICGQSVREVIQLGRRKKNTTVVKPGRTVETRGISMAQVGEREGGIERYRGGGGMERNRAGAGGAGGG